MQSVNTLIHRFLERVAVCESVVFNNAIVSRLIVHLCDEASAKTL